MEPQMLFKRCSKKFHGTPEVAPWNFLIKMSSNEIWKEILIYIWYVMNNTRTSCGISQTLALNPVISLGMRSANERRRYILTASLIGWVHT